MDIKLNIMQMGLIKIQLRLTSLPLSGASAIHTCITINHKNINFWGDLLVVLIIYLLVVLPVAGGLT